MTTKSLKSRISRHFSYSKNYCYALRSALDKYGRENFEVSQIATASSIDELKELEKEYIKKENSLYPNGYNLTTGGDFFKMHEIAKNKISEANKRRVWSEESKLKSSNSSKGILKRKSPVSEEERKLQSEKAKKQHESGILSKAKWYNQTKIFIPELDMCFYGYSAFVQFLGLDKKFGTSAQSAAEDGYKYKKKYTIIRADWSEDRKQEQIKKCSVNQEEKIAKIHGKPLKCIQNEKIYLSAGQAAKDLNINRRSLSKYVNQGKSYMGYTFEFVKKESLT